MGEVKLMAANSCMAKLEQFPLPCFKNRCWVLTICGVSVDDFVLLVCSWFLFPSSVFF